MKPAKGGSDWRNESAPVRNAESGATLPAKTGINRDTREAVHLQLQPPLNNDHQSPPSAGFRWLPLASAGFRFKVNSTWRCSQLMGYDSADHQVVCK